MCVCVWMCLIYIYHLDIDNFASLDMYSYVFINKELLYHR